MNEFHEDLKSLLMQALPKLFPPGLVTRTLFPPDTLPTLMGGRGQACCFFIAFQVLVEFLHPVPPESFRVRGSEVTAHAGNLVTLLLLHSSQQAH